ncbi:MAG: hypothetical protein AAF468_22295 [Pseudomonadota bacterium]
MPEIQAPPHFTPKAMRRFALKRIQRIEHSAHEIAYAYGDVDNTVCCAVDALLEQLNEISQTVEESCENGVTL